MRRSRIVRRVAALVLVVGAACGEETDRAEELARTARGESLARALAGVVSTGELAALDTILSADYARHGPATPGERIEGVEEYRAFLAEQRETFPDLEWSIDRLVAGDSLVAFWGTLSGTQRGRMDIFPPTGERAEVKIAGMHRVEGGRIAESWMTWDNVSALVQLGHWEVTPPPVGTRGGEPLFCAVRVPANRPVVEEDP